MREKERESVCACERVCVRVPFCRCLVIYYLAAKIRFHSHQMPAAKGAVQSEMDNYIGRAGKQQ